jgi:DedD protein
MNMAKTDTPQATDSADAAPADDDETLRKRLLSRIAVAGVVIVGLLGGLAVYDSLNKPQAPVLPKMAAPAEGEATKTEGPQAVAEKAAEEKPVAEEKAAAEKPAETKTAAAEVVPERTETPLAPPPPEKSLKPAKTLTPPASAQPAAIKPAAPAVAPVKPDAAREVARVMPERTAPAVAERKATAHAPASRPLTQAAESARRFLLQVGVFSNHANAEELVTRLHEAGIPAQIESRVQVGPFASRQEAEAARSKLKTLGIDDGMLVRR